MTESVNFSSDSNVDNLDTFLELDQIQEALHQKGYQTDYFSNAGDTMLHLAAKKGDLEAIQLGIAFGLKKEAVNKAGNTFVHLAAQKGVLHIVAEYELLLFEKNNLGQTPYHLALKHEKMDVVDFYHEHTHQLPNQPIDRLIALGYSPDLMTGYQLVMKAVKNNDINALKLMGHYYEGRGQLFQQLDGQALTVAAKKGNFFILDFLLKCGVSINGRNDAGNTLLQEGFLNGNLPLIEYVLSHNGVNANLLDKKGWAPLHYACEKGLLSIAKRLIELGADVNMRSVSEWYNETADWSWDDWDAWADAPCAVGMPISGPVNTIYSPLALAQRFNHEELSEFLKDHGAEYYLNPRVI